MSDGVLGNISGAFSSAGSAMSNLGSSALQGAQSWLSSLASPSGSSQYASLMSQQQQYNAPPPPQAPPQYGEIKKGSSMVMSAPSSGGLNFGALTGAGSPFAPQFDAFTRFFSGAPATPSAAPFTPAPQANLVGGGSVAALPSIPSAPQKSMTMVSPISTPNFRELNINIPAATPLPAPSYLNTMTGYYTNVGDQFTNAGTSKSIVGTVQKDTWSQPGQAIDVKINSPIEALVFKAQQSRAGVNPDVGTGDLKQTQAGAARFYENELDKALGSAVRLSSDYHHKAMDTGVAQLPNPYENAGDVALAILKGGNARDDFAKNYAFSPAVGSVLGYLPGGKGTQEYAWDRAAGKFGGAIPNFMPSIKLFEKAQGEYGPYEKLGSYTQAGERIPVPLENVVKLPSAYFEAFASPKVGEARMDVIGGAQFGKVPGTLGTVGVGAGDNLQWKIFGKTSDVIGKGVLPPELTEGGGAKAPSLLSPITFGSTKEINDQIASFIGVPPASAAGAEVLPQYKEFGAEGALGAGAPRVIISGAVPAAPAASVDLSRNIRDIPAPQTNATIDDLKASAERKLAAGDYVGAALDANLAATGMVSDVAGKAAVETAQQTAGFGLSVLDQMPLVGKPVTDVLLDTFGGYMGASKDVDRYGSYSRISRRIGQELQNVTGVRAGALRAEAEAADSSAGGLVEKFYKHAAASALENPGQIPSAVESGLILGAGFGKLGQIATPYIASIGTKLTGTGVGGVKAVAGVLGNRWIPAGLVVLGQAAEGTKGFTEWEPGKVSSNIGEAFPTSGTQIATIFGYEPLTRQIAKQTMLWNAKTPEEKALVEDLYKAVKDAGKVKVAQERYEALDPTKIENLRGNVAAGQAIKGTLVEKPSLDFGSMVAAAQKAKGGGQIVLNVGGESVALRGTAHDIDILTLAQTEKQFATDLANLLGNNFRVEGGLVVDAKSGAHIADVHTLFSEATVPGQSLYQSIKSTPLVDSKILKDVVITGPTGEQTASISMRAQLFNKINSLFGAPIEGGGWRFLPEEHRAVKDIGDTIVYTKYMARIAAEEGNPALAKSLDATAERLAANPMLSSYWAEYKSSLLGGGPPTLPSIKQVSLPSMLPPVFPNTPPPSIKAPSPVPSTPTPLNINMPASQVKNLPSTLFTPPGPPSTIKETKQPFFEVSDLMRMLNPPSVLTPEAFPNVPVPPSKMLAQPPSAVSPLNVNIPASQVSKLKSEMFASKVTEPSSKFLADIVIPSKLASYIAPSMISTYKPPSSVEPPSKPSEPSKPPYDGSGGSSKPPYDGSGGSSKPPSGDSYYYNSSYVPPYVPPSTPPSEPSSPSVSSMQSYYRGGPPIIPPFPFLAPPGGGGGAGGGSQKGQIIVRNPLAALKLSSSMRKFGDFVNVNKLVSGVSGNIFKMGSKISVEPTVGGEPSTAKATISRGVASSIEEATAITRKSIKVPTLAKRKGKSKNVFAVSIKPLKVSFTLKAKPKKKSRSKRKKGTYK
jgi:hypothetical protein